MLLIMTLKDTNLREREPKGAITFLALHLLSFPDHILSQIKQVIIVNSKANKVTSIHFQQYGSTERLLKSVVFKKLAGRVGKSKYELVSQLLNKARIEEADAISSKDFIKQLQETEVAFYYPYFDSELQNLLAELPRRKFFIRRRIIENRKPTTTLYKIEDVDRFFLLVEKTNKMKSSSNANKDNSFVSLDENGMPDDASDAKIRSCDNNLVDEAEYVDAEEYLKDKGFLPVGKYYLQNSDYKKGKIKNWFLLTGDYEYYSEVLADYLIHDKDEVFEHDLKYGLPRNIPDKSDLCFNNLHYLDSEDQWRLFKLLKGSNAENQTILLFSSEAPHSSQISEYFNSVNFPDRSVERNEVVSAFIALLLEKTIKRKLKTGKTKSKKRSIKAKGELRLPEEILSGKFLGRISGKTQFSMTSALRTFSSLNQTFKIKAAQQLYSPDFWYLILLEFDSLNMEKNSKSEAARENVYKILYRFNLWEVSFGSAYKITLPKADGIAYIAHLIDRAQKSPDVPQKAYEIMDLVKGDSNKVKDYNSIPAVRKAIREKIEEIEILEKEMGLKNEFSQYLRKVFLPKTITVSDNKPYSKKVVFDEDEYEINCKLPVEYDIYWEISTPSRIQD